MKYLLLPKRIFSFVLAVVLTTSLVPIPAFAAPENGTSENTAAETVELSTQSDTKEMYRLYNRWSGEHFFTSDYNEMKHLSSIGWTYEGVAWLAPTQGNPVYRLYNKWSGDHHFTLDASERDACLKAGWTDENIGFYSPSSGVPVYRVYNPYVKSFYHHYTTDANEYKHLMNVGWRDEGIGWYGYEAPASSPSNPTPSPSPSPDPTPQPPSYSNEVELAEKAVAVQPSEISNISGNNVTVTGAKAETLQQGSVILIEPSQAYPTGKAMKVQSVSKSGSTATASTTQAMLQEAIESASFASKSSKVLSITSKVPMKRSGSGTIRTQAAGETGAFDTQAVEGSFDLETFTFTPFDNCEVTVSPSVEASIDYFDGQLQSCKVLVNVNTSATFNVSREWSKDIELAEAVFQLPYGFAVKAKIVLTAGASGSINVEARLTTSGGINYYHGSFTPLGTNDLQFSAQADASIWVGLRPGLTLTAFGIAGIVGVDAELGVRADASVSYAPEEPNFLCMDLDAYPYVEISIAADTLMNTVMDWLKLDKDYTVLDEANSLLTNLHYENNNKVSACTWAGAQKKPDSGSTPPKQEVTAGVKQFKDNFTSQGRNFYSHLTDYSLWMWGGASSTPVRLMENVKDFSFDMSGDASRDACYATRVLQNDGTFWVRWDCYNGCKVHRSPGRFNRVATGVKAYADSGRTILKNDGTLWVYVLYTKRFEKIRDGVATLAKDQESGFDQYFITNSGTLYVLENFLSTESYSGSDGRLSSWGIKPVMAKVCDGVSSVEDKNCYFSAGADQVTGRIVTITKTDGSKTFARLGDHESNKIGNGQGGYKGVQPKETTYSELLLLPAGAIKAYGLESNGRGPWILRNDDALCRLNSAFSGFEPVLQNVLVVSDDGCNAIKKDGTLWREETEGNWNQIDEHKHAVDLATGNISDSSQILQNAKYIKFVNDNYIITNDNALWVDGYRLNPSDPKVHCSSDYYKVMTDVREKYTSSDYGDFECTDFVVKTDGTLWAKGDNGRGQLGDGTGQRSNDYKQIRFAA